MSISEVTRTRSLPLAVLLFLDHLRALHVGRVRKPDGLAFGRPDLDVLHLPVARVLDEARLLALGVDVDEGHADDGLLGQPRGREDAFGADDLDVLDADVAELAVAALDGEYGRVHHDPVRRRVRDLLRDGRVGVARVPVQGESEGERHVLHPDVANEHVRDVAAARLRRLEAQALVRADAAVAVGDDVADAARGLAAEGEHAAAAPREVVAHDDVLGRPRDAQPVVVAPGLQTDVVVVVVDVAVLDEDVRGGVDVHAVGARAAVVADLDAVNGDVVGEDDLHRPEAGALEAQVLDRHVRRLPDDHEAHALGVVVRGPAQAARLVVVAPQVPVLVPPLLAAPVDGAAAGEPDVPLVVDVNEGRRPLHLDAGDARVDGGVVRVLLTPEQRDALADDEADARLDEERARHVLARLEADDAAARLRARVDGCLYRLRRVRLAVADRAVRVRLEDRLPRRLPPRAHRLHPRGQPRLRGFRRGLRRNLRAERRREDEEQRRN